MIPFKKWLFGKKYQIYFHVIDPFLPEYTPVVVELEFREKKKERARKRIKDQYLYLVKVFKVSHSDVFLLPDNLKRNGL